MIPNDRASPAEQLAWRRRHTAPSMLSGRAQQWQFFGKRGESTDTQPEQPPEKLVIRRYASGALVHGHDGSEPYEVVRK